MESNTPNFTNDFKKSLEFTLKWEGGYVNDPDDPGGETKWGISKRAYPDLDIKNLSPEIAATIYFRDYFVPSGAVNLPFPECVVAFDTAVNLGVGRCKQFIEINETGAKGLIAQREAYYIGLIKKKPALQKYLKGWLNRLNDLKKFIEINSQAS